ncbi:MAG: type II 3-dehydroquinate dehydratase [Gammaproteobacteria bacterium]|nr:type II 3-dehydroquinate dehydratase [Gammaproteobacteria bacterium]|tara:strand:- start:5669 stop:6100 length:432 start_codon:yes stop_codon:yes gene_type:complete
MAKILVLHGPNLNLLGTREPEVYGTDTLENINSHLRHKVEAASHEFEAFQSNAEHELIDKIHEAKGSVSFVVINPGAFTHTSIALRDAFLGVSIPFIEVHLSNVHEREDFRQHSYLSDIALGVISGLGSQGYEMAIDSALDNI